MCLELKRGENPLKCAGELMRGSTLLRKNLPLPLVKGKGIKGMGFPK
jgi:hypothetical protein